MKKYRVTMPDGGSQVVELPEGSSREAIKKRANVLYKPQFERDAEAIKNASAVDLVMGSPPGRYVQGVGELFRGGLQGAAHLSGNETAINYMDNVEKERGKSQKRSDLAYGREGVDWMRLLGNMSNPVTWKLMQKTPPSAWGRIGMGTAAGLGYGALAPVEDTENYAINKGFQIGAGGLLGGLIPAGMEGVRLGLKTGKHLLEPAFKWGRDNIKAREWLNAAGDKADEIVSYLDDAEPDVMRNRYNLKNPRGIEPRANALRPGELVPGSRPTAAEAAAPAGSAEFAALQKSVSGHKPSEYLARAKEQQAARVASLKTVAKTPEDLKAAINVRSANSRANYKKAYEEQVKVDLELADIADNKYFRDAVKTALDKAEVEKIDPKTDTTHFYHLVKRGLDEQLDKVGDGAVSGETRRLVQIVKSRLVNWLGKKSPAYDKARTQFAEDSDPINRMIVGQELEKVLSPPVSDIAEVGAQRTGPFAGAMRDSTQLIKKTGQDPRFGGLKDIFKKHPEDLVKIQKISQDLARRAQFEEQARAGMRGGKGNIVKSQLERETGGATLPNPLNRTIMVLNALLRRMQGKASEAVQEEMAINMLDPKIVADIMRKAMIPRHRQEVILGAITKAQAPAVAGAASAGGQDPVATLRKGAAAAKFLWPGGNR